MDAPPIQYAKTTDGVKIAFWTLGEGPPRRRSERRMGNSSDVRPVAGHLI